MFYLALGRLLLVELGEDEEKFERFITPLTGEAAQQDIVIFKCTKADSLVHSVLSIVSLFHSEVPLLSFTREAPLHAHFFQLVRSLLILLQLLLREYRATLSSRS